jgi:hypothetical protein
VLGGHSRSFWKFNIEYFLYSGCAHTIVSLIRRRIHRLLFLPWPLRWLLTWLPPKHRLLRPLDFMLGQRRAWEILEVARPGDRSSRAFDVAILLLIALNVLAVILETVAGFEARYGSYFLGFERFSVTVFSLEYVSRVWSAPTDPRYGGTVRGRLTYMITPMALIDLLAILPFFLPFVGIDLRFVRAFRLMRFFRIVKAGRYLSALRLFGAVARAKKEELVLTTFIVVLLLLTSSSLMYFAEHAAQPEAFPASRQRCGGQLLH